MKKWSVLIVALVFTASSAWAFRGGCGAGPGLGSWISPYLSSELDLTEDQKAQLQAKEEALQTEVNPLRDELFSKRMELRSLWTQNPIDEAKILAKQKEIQTIQNQIQDKVTLHRLECRQLLTAEQREKLGTLQGQGKGWGRHRGMRGNCPNR